MNAIITRRHFIQRSSGSVVAISALGSVALAGQAPATGPSATAPAKRQRPAPLAPERVREFVGAGHGQLDRCKEMLEEYPGLINATWDWGGGDWETALGGAAHMGRPDIANVLLERGARLDLFAAAMLGRLDIVRAACTAFPNTPKVPGPHGISLMEHARKGGEAARSVAEYLESLG